MLVSSSYHCSASTGGTKAKKKTRIADEATFPDVERAVWAWHCDQRRRNFSVSGDMLVVKATAAYKYLHPRTKEWIPSAGWLDGFKRRYDIRCLKVAGESCSADVAAARQYVYTFKRKYGHIGEW